MLSSFDWIKVISRMWYRDTIKILHLNHEIRQSVLSLQPHSLLQILSDCNVVEAIHLVRSPNCLSLIDQELGGQDICDYVRNIIGQFKLAEQDHLIKIIVGIFSQLYPNLPIVLCDLQYCRTVRYHRSTAVSRFSEHFLDYVKKEQITNLEPFAYDYSGVLLTALTQGKMDIFWTIFDQFDHFPLNYRTVSHNNICRAFGRDNYLPLLDKCYELAEHRPDVLPIIRLLQHSLHQFDTDIFLRDKYFNIIKYTFKRSPVKKFIMACVEQRMDYVAQHIMSMPQLFMEKGFDFSSLTNAFPNLLATIKPLLSADDYYYLLCQTYEKLPSHDHPVSFLNLAYCRHYVRQILSEIHNVDDLPETVAETHISRRMYDEYKVIQPPMYVLLDEAIKIHSPMLEDLIEFVRQTGDDDQLLEACIYYRLPEVFTLLHNNVPMHLLLMAVINNDYHQARNLLTDAARDLIYSEVVSVWDIVKYTNNIPIQRLVMNTPVVKAQFLRHSSRLYGYLKRN
jgi:hypothetical protein